MAQVIVIPHESGLTADIFVPYGKALWMKVYLVIKYEAEYDHGHPVAVFVGSQEDAEKFYLDYVKTTSQEALKAFAADPRRGLPFDELGLQEWDPATQLSVVIPNDEIPGWVDHSCERGEEYTRIMSALNDPFPASGAVRTFSAE